MQNNEELEKLAAKLLQSGVCRTSMEAKSMAQGMISGSQKTTAHAKSLRELTKESTADDFLSNATQITEREPQTISGYENAIEKLTDQIRSLQQTMQSLSQRLSKLEEKSDVSKDNFVMDNTDSE